MNSTVTLSVVEWKKDKSPIEKHFDYAQCDGKRKSLTI